MQSIQFLDGGVGLNDDGGFNNGGGFNDEGGFNDGSGFNDGGGFNDEGGFNDSGGFNDEDGFSDEGHDHDEADTDIFYVTMSQIADEQRKIIPEYIEALAFNFMSTHRISPTCYILQDWDIGKQELKVLKSFLTFLKHAYIRTENTNTSIV